MAFEHTRRYALPVAVVVTVCAVGAQLGAPGLARTDPLGAAPGREFAHALRIAALAVNALVLVAAWGLGRRRWVVVALALLGAGGAALGYLTEKKVEREVR